MFNVCPGCGEYSAEKSVMREPVRAICGACGHEYRFQSLPLYVVTGASCTGKTTTLLALSETPGNFVALDQDILWSDYWNEPRVDHKAFREMWMRMVKSIHQAGRSVILFGSCVPEQYESTIERRYVSAVNYAALVCQPAELERRLRERPSWRKSGTEENIEQMIKFNEWLMTNAEKTVPQMTLIDTTSASIDQTVQSIRSWFDEGQRRVV